MHSMTSHGPVENPGKMKIRSLLHNLFSTKRPWEFIHSYQARTPFFRLFCDFGLYGKKSSEKLIIDADSFFSARCPEFLIIKNSSECGSLEYSSKICVFHKSHKI